MDEVRTSAYLSGTRLLLKRARAAIECDEWKGFEAVCMTEDPAVILYLVPHVGKPTPEQKTFNLALLDYLTAKAASYG